MGNFMCICTMYTISRLGLKKKEKKKVTGFFPLSLTTLLVLPVLIIGLEIELVKELTNSSWRKDNTFRDYQPMHHPIWSDRQLIGTASIVLRVLSNCLPIVS